MPTLRTSLHTGEDQQAENVEKGPEKYAKFPVFHLNLLLPLVISC